MNIAEQIVKQFPDESRVTDEFHTRLTALGRPVRHTKRHDLVQWTFLDGSVIVTAGGQWDIGYAACFCFVSTGHKGECNASNK